MRLESLQTMLGEIYDVPLAYNVADFLLTDREELPQRLRASATDEQVLVQQDGGSLRMGVYVEQGVLERLASENPLESLHGGNIADYWTALEGVSHFLYIAWNAGYDRQVTLLELELQAEIDKYVSSVFLLREQNPGHVPVELHHVLFERCRVDDGLAGERVGLYRRADAYASRFCRRLARTLCATGCAARAAAFSELRRFYRLSHERKLRHIESVS